MRCPHCHNLIEIRAEDSPLDFTCPICGSKFNLISDMTKSYVPRVKRTIGQFELTEELGVGAFGSVWKAKDIIAQRQVAIKLPRKEQLDLAELQMFVHEARAAAKLKHPNIVTIFEVKSEGEDVYIVNELIEGVNLKDWLTGRRLSAGEAAELCEKIANAVQYAHEQGIIHRDLKPSNILMDAAGEPHVTDFGLAKGEDGELSITIDGAILGTPAYMSPEQARGESQIADRRSDVYSLGVILYELLTGELPFRGNPRMLVHQAVHADPPPPRQLDDRVPRALDAVCLKAMNKEPHQRYDTADELAADLHRFQVGEPVSVRRHGRTARIIKWCRHPERVRDAGSVALFVAAVGIFLRLSAIALMYLKFGPFPSDVIESEATLSLLLAMACIDIPNLACGLGTILRKPLAMWAGTLLAAFHVLYSMVWAHSPWLWGGAEHMTYGRLFVDPALRATLGTTLAIIMAIKFLVYAMALFAYYSNPNLMRWYRESRATRDSTANSE